MILQALDKAGGVQYLTNQAHENPGPFLSLIGKVLPTTISGDPNNPLVINWPIAPPRIARNGDG